MSSNLKKGISRELWDWNAMRVQLLKRILSPFRLHNRSIHFHIQTLPFHHSLEIHPPSQFQNQSLLSPSDPSPVANQEVHMCWGLSISKVWLVFLPTMEPKPYSLPCHHLSGWFWMASPHLLFASLSWFQTDCLNKEGWWNYALAANVEGSKVREDLSSHLALSSLHWCQGRCRGSGTCSKVLCSRSWPVLWCPEVGFQKCITPCKKTVCFRQEGFCSYNLFPLLTQPTHHHLPSSGVTEPPCIVMADMFWST